MIYWNLTTQECTSCDEKIKLGEVYINIPKNKVKHFLSEEKKSQTSGWHQSCFCCDVCKQQLADNVYCKYDNKIYCVRHYSELFKPRCFTCDEVCWKKFLFAYN